MQPFPGRGRIFLLRHGETDWNRERRIMEMCIRDSDEGFAEIAEWFETLARAEKSHAGRFQKGLDSLSQG